MSHTTDQQRAKRAAAEAAAELVEEGMTIGLGTGSTAACFIDALAKRCQEGLNIQAVATSNHSSQQAEAAGIPVLDSNTCKELDLDFDGADEIDSAKRMIKGGGGALLREKIIASMAQEMVVIIDSTKRVEALGHFPLAIEIVPFGWSATAHHLKKMGLMAKRRKGQEGEAYVTDNGNYILDIALSFPCQNPEEINQQILSIPGVVETGFFFELAGRVVVGYPDETTTLW